LLASSFSRGRSNGGEIVYFIRVRPLEREVFFSFEHYCTIASIWLPLYIVGTSKVVRKGNFLFEVVDVFGNKIRTTKSYWNKIITKKHPDFKYSTKEIENTIKKPDTVFRSIQDPTIVLYRKKMESDTIVIVAKLLNSDGFVVTFYQTTKPQKKGEVLWPK